MNYRRKKSSENNKVNNKKIRCKSKMIPVFETDTYDYFLKKENVDSNKICRNCLNSF